MPKTRIIDARSHSIEQIAEFLDPKGERIGIEALRVASYAARAAGIILAVDAVFFGRHESARPAIALLAGSTLA